MQRLVEELDNMKDGYMIIPTSGKETLLVKVEEYILIHLKGTNEISVFNREIDEELDRLEMLVNEDNDLAKIGEQICDWYFQDEGKVVLSYMSLCKMDEGKEEVMEALEEVVEELDSIIDKVVDDYFKKHLGIKKR